MKNVPVGLQDDHSRSAAYASNNTPPPQSAYVVFQSALEAEANWADLIGAGANRVARPLITVQEYNWRSREAPGSAARAGVSPRRRGGTHDTSSRPRQDAGAVLALQNDSISLDHIHERSRVQARDAAIATAKMKLRALAHESALLTT